MGFIFGLLAFFTVYCGEAVARFGDKYKWIRVLFFTLYATTTVTSICCWENGCRWPVFVDWAILAFCSFSEVFNIFNEDDKKVRTAPKVALIISLIGLYTTGNVLGFCYNMDGPLGIVSVMEFFTVLTIICVLFEKKAN